MAAKPRSHPKQEPLFGAGEENHQLEVLQQVRATEALSQPQCRGHSGRVVVGPRHDSRQSDVREQRHRHDQHHGGQELHDGDGQQVDSDEPQQGADDDRDEGPEEERERPDRPPDRLAERGPALERAAAEHGARTSGVVVRG